MGVMEILITADAEIAKTVMVSLPPSSFPCETHPLEKLSTKTILLSTSAAQRCGFVSLLVPGADLGAHKCEGWLPPNMRTQSMTVKS